MKTSKLMILLIVSRSQFKKNNSLSTSPINSCISVVPNLASNLPNTRGKESIGNPSRALKCESIALTVNPAVASKECPLGRTNGPINLSRIVYVYGLSDLVLDTFSRETDASKSPRRQILFCLIGPSFLLLTFAWTCQPI